MEQKQYEQKNQDAFNDYLEQLNADLDEIEQEKNEGYFRTDQRHEKDTDNGIIVGGIVAAACIFLSILMAKTLTDRGANVYNDWDDPAVEVVEEDNFILDDEEITAFRKMFNTFVNEPIVIDGTECTWNTSLKDFNDAGWEENEYEDNCFDMKKDGYHMQVTFEDYRLTKLTDISINDDGLPVTMPLGIQKGMGREEVLKKFSELGLDAIVQEEEFEIRIAAGVPDENGDEIYMDYAIYMGDDEVVSCNICGSDQTDYYSFSYN